MRDDIQDYNKAAVTSEEQMLLFNLGRLYSDQSPHFMMLSSVSQSRTFSAGASVQWSQLWNSLASPFAAIGNVKNTGTVTAGPFTGAVNENPTITFVPIQGQDFALRFESSLTDKFALFLEDRRWSPTALAEKEAITNLMVQSMYLPHGDPTNGGSCVWGVNENGSPMFSDCISEIIRSKKYYGMIDGSYPVPTGSSEGPKAADLVTALGAGYEFPKDGDKGALSTPVRIPAWFDYNPTAPPKKPDSSVPVFWAQGTKPDWWQYTAYYIPKDYKWNVYKYDKNNSGSADVYALVPDGYDLDRNPTNGILTLDSNGNYTIKKAKEPSTAHPYTDFSYTDEVISDVWPVTKDYFYVELRRGQVDDATAERLCHSAPDGTDPSRLVCGYLKIGNLLQIMQRLARKACPSRDPQVVKRNCQQSVFGIGPEVPAWADSSASFIYHTPDGLEQTQWVWVPAHDPKKDPYPAERDRIAFMTLYKLYQMSLVDTTKLVMGAPPITISK